MPARRKRPSRSFRFISSVANGNSRGPEALAELVAELGPRARAATAEDAAKTGEIVVVSIPLKNYREVPVAPLAGKVVIDTNNYYPQRDGHTAELDNESTTTAELLQAHLPTSKVVKAFTYLCCGADHARQPAGSKNRRALVIAGRDAKAGDETARKFRVRHRGCRALAGRMASSARYAGLRSASHG